MKTIGKKIKAIYFLAVIAIVSMCMAILPLMSTNVKAETKESGLRVVGAQVVVIDETTTAQNFDGKYAISFQAEFTKELYEKLSVRGNTVKFGMLVGSIDKYDAVTSIETALENGYVNSCFLGNKDCEQYVSFELGETTCKYEASIEYSETDVVDGLTTNAEKIDALLAQSSQELTAIPYYVVNGEVTVVKANNPIVRSARKLINDEYSLSNLEFGDALYERYVGTFDDDYSGCEYYVEKQTGMVYKADANNELIPFFAGDFVGSAQFVVDGKDAEPTALDKLTLSQQTMDALVEGQEYSIAAFLDDADNTVRTIKAKVVTKIISKIEDFFNDVDGDGLGDVAQANYIFRLVDINKTWYHTTETVVTGYYILGANIDLQGNDNLVSAFGDVRLQSTVAKSGFMATLDGRGFAISNINPGRSASGMFGMFNGATIKNIAFDGFTSGRNDGTPALLSYNTYNSTFENVYIRLNPVANAAGDSYVSVPKVFGAISELYGKNTFTNVVYENAVALEEGKQNKHNRVIFTDDVTSNYTNTSVIGLPANYTQTAHETDTEKRVLTLCVSSAAMTNFGVKAGEYALADCPAAVTTAYAGLIKNIETKFSVSIGYITFVEDTSGRDYYLDNAALVADETATNAYLETGMWKKVGNELVWNSLFAEKFTVKSSNDDPTDMTFTDSITLEMFKGDDKIENIRIRTREEDADFITVSGTTITKKPEAALIKTRDITVDVVYTVGAKSYEVAVDLLLELDYSNLNVYQSGEFIIETSTGKVYAPNANNELVDFDATGYLANATKLYFAGIEIETVSANPFTIDVAALEDAKLGEKQPIVAICNGEARYLLASTASKVLFSAKDFFVDADGSGTVEDAEMVQANYIFYLGTDNSSGLIRPQKTIKGYYVLANNINLSGVAIGNGDSGERHYQIADATGNLGFNGTFDGRGFALQNGNPSRTTGMFGMFYGATVKNVAFDGFTNSVGNSNALILGRAYNSTFENIYFRITGNNGGDTWAGAGNTFTTIYSADDLGISNFNNIVFESMDGLTAGNTNRHQRQTLIGNATIGSFTNTSIIGMPVTFAYAGQHATDTEKAVLTLTLPAATLSAFGVEAGEYAIADCQAAATAFAGLIANIEGRQTSQIGYINFVEDTKDRDYYLDNIAFSADTDVVASYVATGYWTQLGDIIAWKSLVNAENFTVKSNAADPESLVFTDSITIDMYYGATKLEDLTLEVDDEFSSLIEINGTTISKKEGALLTSDVKIPVKVIYGAFSKSVEALLQLDVASIETYESGEFIVDKSTGKVFKADAKTNELVVYDATNFTANMTAIYVGGVEVTASSTTEFNLGVDAVKNLPLMEEAAITVTFNNGGTSSARYLKVKAVTKVFFSVNDFYNDADGSGVVEDTEMIDANYIFYQGASLVNRYDGYYVLANNINVNNKPMHVGTNNNFKPTLGTDTTLGVAATIDGRGFALSNINGGWVAGMFGILNGATIKNIAFIDIRAEGDDSTNTALAWTAYDTTFENVYIRAKQFSYARSWISNTKYIGTIKTPCTFTNVVFENTVGLNESYSMIQSSWMNHSDTTASTYTNTTIVGVPSALARAKHATNTDKYVLTMALTSAEMTRLGVSAGEYNLANCEAAATQYANLIAGIESAKSIDIDYINFVAEERFDYYISSSALASSESATTYTATGMWINLGGELLWKSLAGADKLTVKASAEDGKFVDSITVDMYYNEAKLEGVELSVSTEDAKLVEISGNTITRKTNAQILADKVITVTANYNGLSATIDVTLLFDLDSVVAYEEGEVVVEQSTGKVFKANEKNELKAYDATSYLANAETVLIAGEEVAVANASEFALDTADIEALTVGNEYLMTAGENAFIVKITTKVLSTVADFFVDADGSGTVEDTEMIQANYIFNLQVIAGDGARNPQVAIKGYYVLANNIDLQSKTTLVASSLGDQTVQIFDGSKDVGFRGTLDGRGFALTNGNTGGSSGGMFGAFYGATIKNIAFDGFQSTKNDGSVVILGYAYLSTFENVYIRVIGNENGDSYLSSNAGLSVLGISDQHGGSSFTNIVFESTVGLETGKTNDHNRITFSNQAAGTFENTTIIGMPVTFKYAAHTSNTTKYVLSLTFPADVLTSLGVEANKEYALSALPEAVTNAYGDLIANIESKAVIDIEYVTFIADCDGRVYYLDNASLVADTDLVNTYVATGFWKVVEGALVWASLA